MAPSGYQDILRLGEGERRALVDVLNARPNDEDAKKHRTGDRYPYFVPEGLPVELRQQEGSLGTFLVSPRNISVGGMSFLHGMFLYRGTKCLLSLKTRDGRHQETSGEVARCRCIHGRIHEIGVAFHLPIEIDKFVDTATPLELPKELAYSAVDVVGLARRLQDQAFHGAPIEDVRATIRDLARIVRRADA